jgi:hypothetical protein
MSEIRVLIDPKAESELKDLISDLKEVRDLTEEIKSKKGKLVEAKGVEEVSNLTAEIEQLRSQIEKLTSEKVKAAKGSGDLEKAVSKLSKSHTKEAQELANVQEKLRQQNQVLRQNAKDSGLAEGSLAKMRIELSRLQKQYDNLSAAERNNKQVGGELLIQIQQLDKETKKLEESTGRHQRSVGDYAKGFRGLSGILSVIERKLGIQLGIISSSVNATSKLLKGYKGLSSGLLETKGATEQATASQKAWNAVKSVSILGVGLFAVALLGAVSAILYFTDSTKKSKEELEKEKQETEKNTKAKRDLIDAIDDLIDKRRVERGELSQEQAEENEVNRKFQREQEDVEAEFQEKLTELEGKAQKERREQKNKQLSQGLIGTIKVNEKEIKLSKGLSDEISKVEGEKADRLTLIEEKRLEEIGLIRDKRNKETNKTADDLNKEAEAKEKARLKAIESLRNEHLLKITQLITDEVERSIAVEKHRAEVEKTIIKERAKELKLSRQELNKILEDIEQIHQNNILKIIEDAAKKQLDKELSETDREANEKFRKLKESNAKEKELNALEFDIRLKEAGNNENKITEIKREQFKKREEDLRISVLGQEITEKEYLLRLRELQLEQADFEKKLREKQVKEIIDSFDILNEAQNKAAQKRIAEMQKQTQDEISELDRRINFQNQLLLNGEKNISAELEKERADALLRKRQLEEKARRQEEAQQLVSYLFELAKILAKDGDKNAELKAFAKTVALKELGKALAGGLYEGTESVSRSDAAMIIPGAKKDNLLVRMHEGERVVGYEDSKKLDGISNAELIKAAELYRMNIFNKEQILADVPKKEQVDNAVMKLLSDKLDKLNSTIENAPNFVEIGRTIYGELYRIERENKITKKIITKEIGTSYSKD